MYSNPSQTPTWNPNAPPNPQQAPPNQSPSQTAAVQHQQQQQQQQQPQHQQQWSSQPSGQFALRPNQQIPPISQAIQQNGPTMQTLQPQHPDQYRALPAPPQMYNPAYGPPPPTAQYVPVQPAPRQRTAIACRYCRRRKIRCSGFDQSEDGRCTNCQRFAQECVFTPVSAQTQAFVPAHTVWRGQQPPANAQLYGAYGQPLRGDPYAQQSQQPQQQQAPPPQQQQQQQQQPQGPQQAGQYPPPPPGYQQQGYAQAAPMAGPSKRPNDEPHTPTLPPPAPGGYVYPDPVTGLPTHRSESISGVSVDSNERRLERMRNGEVKDAGVQTDVVYISKDPI